MHLVELKKLFHLNFGNKSVIIKNVKGHSKSTFIVEGKGKEGGGGRCLKANENEQEEWEEIKPIFTFAL